MYIRTNVTKWNMFQELVPQQLRGTEAVKELGTRFAYSVVHIFDEYLPEFPGTYHADGTIIELNMSIYEAVAYINETSVMWLTSQYGGRMDDRFYYLPEFILKIIDQDERGRVLETIKDSFKEWTKQLAI